MSSSSISWLDFSEAERRKMVEIVSLFKERDTRDELGIATIRDSFADLFFPGTSTLQTRARYFLFIPWLYRHYEITHVPSAKISSRLSQDEIYLIDALIRSGESGSVIGQRSGASLHRFPSSIYWIGLQSWGICRFPGTQEQYQRSLDHWNERQKIRTEVDEINQDDGFQINWDSDLPMKPEGFPSQANFALTNGEAQYLKDRLLLSCTESLLAYLVEHTQPIDDTVHFPWFHSSIGTFPSRLQNWLIHARNFSETIHGAALLYNLKLAELAKNEELVSQYHENMEQWYARLRIRQEAWPQWNRIEFWALAARPGVNVPTLSRKFVDEWLDRLFINGKISQPEKSKDMISLVEKREQYLKGSRSRFKSKRHLDMWSGASFAGQIDYRWRIARRITNDILEGLSERDNH